MPLREIELATYLEQKWKTEKSGQDGVETTFKKDTNQTTAAMSKGFAALANVYSKSASDLVTGEQARKKNVTAKWAAAQDYQNALQARHSTPGHALNYAERYQRISQMLQQDIGIAYQKLRCLSLACNSLFNLNYPLDPPKEVGYLDYVVTYMRELINKVEIATVKEVNFNHTVYLRQPKSVSSGNAPGTPHVTNPLWNDILGGSRLFEINLSNEFPAAITRLRVLSVGLSMSLGTPGAGDTTTTLKSASAIVFPPEAKDFFSPGATRKRPPILIEGVGLTGPGTPSMVGSSSVRHIDPRGEWRVQLSSNFYQPDATKPGSPTSEGIQDVKLHLALSGLLSDDSNEWKDFAM